MIPKLSKFGMINNAKDNMDFQFTSVLDQRSTQEEVLKTVTLPVVHQYQLYH